MTGKTPNIFEIILLWWRQFIFSRFDTKIQCSKIFANDKAEKSYHFLLRMSIAPLFSWLYPYQSMRIVYLTNLFGSLTNYAVFWMYFPKDCIHAQPECEMKISYSKGFEAIFLTDLISIIQLLDGIHPLLSTSCFAHIFENIMLSISDNIHFNRSLLTRFFYPMSQKLSGLSSWFFYESS